MESCLKDKMWISLCGFGVRFRIGCKGSTERDPIAPTYTCNACSTLATLAVTVWLRITDRKVKVGIRVRLRLDTGFVKSVKVGENILRHLNIPTPPSEASPGGAALIGGRERTYLVLGLGLESWIASWCILS